jgi:ABC-type oligopeptide transport system ATPase subunit
MKAILEARGLHKTFTRREGLTKSAGLQALRDVSISVPAGGVIGIAVSNLIVLYGSLEVTHKL